MNTSAGTMPDFSLNLDSLRNHVDAGTFERGLQVLRNQQVLECELLRSGSQTWEIEGMVSGSKFETYRVSVTLESSTDGHVSHFEGQCSCPVGGDCKHSLALTLKAGYKSGGVFTNSASRAPASLRSGKPDAATAEADASAREQARIEAQRQQAQNKVAQWLDLFGQPPAPGPQADIDADTSSASDHLVYMLSAAQQGGQAVLQLGFGLSRRLKSGSWAKVKTQRSAQAEATSDDLEIVQLIQTLSARSYSYPYSESFGLVSGATGMLALQMAAATGRLFAADDRTLGLPLTLGPALTLGWQWTQASVAKPKRPAASAAATSAVEDTEPVWKLIPKLPDAARGARWYANQPPLYLHEGSGVCGVLEMPGMSADHLQLLIKAPPIPQSALALHETTLLRRLAGLPLPPMMQAPELLQGVKPLARLHINPVALQNQARLGLLRASLQFDYGGVRHYTLNDLNPVLIELAADAAVLPLPAVDNNEPRPAAEPARSSTRRIQLYRDLPAEKAAHNALRTLGLGGDSAGQFYLPFSDPAQQNQWLTWLDDDFAALRQAGFEVTSEPALASWIARADDLQVELAAPTATAANAESGQSLESFDEGRSPWFDLSLGMLIAGQRQNILPMLPELLSQLTAVSHSNGGAGGGSGDTTLQLPEYIYLKQDDGSYLRLPCEPLRPWLQALLDLLGERSSARAGDFKGDALRLSRLEALRLGAAIGEGATWQGAERLRQMVTLLGGRAELPQIAAPEGLMAQLRPYQLHGLQWLQFLRANQLAGILADDMGLGKTLQTLAHILIEKQSGRLDLPVLIIAPVSVMGNWRKEAGRFTPQLSTLVLHGKDRHLAAPGIAQHDIVIAPYSLLQRDRERWQQQAWHLVVLDEAQNIKNASSHAAQVVGELNTRHRLCLSGTPMENHLGELWSLFNFLMPGFLGSQARFKSLYRTPIEKHGDSERAEQLRRRVTPFMLRRHKRDVATDLPEKQIAISSVELGSAQADLYETIRLTTEKTVRDALANKGLAQSQIQILDALLKLRQVCCDPRLLAVPAAQKVRQSAKLELLMELLPELLAEGRKVLLFSQFTSMLRLIEEELVKRGIQWVKLTGQSQKRDEIIDRFTSGEVPLFLISLKAGGVGLNLTQADTVIHYDPWWNPAAETQATDRAHRIGQTQRVMVYKLVAQGTIEERILALQERKAALAESMYSAAEQRNGALFTESDLAALLRPLGS